MRHLLLFASMSLFAANATAQNLAPNPSFESYTTCPIGINGGQGITTTEWTAFVSTPDYYNSCNTTLASTPVNKMGHETPSQGIGYMGMYIYNNAGQQDNKEYIKAELTEGRALQVGTKYKVSLDVSLADTSTTAGNGIGVLFYKDGLGAGYNPSWMDWTIPRTPQIDYTPYGKITNTSGWVTLVDTFVADSGYKSVLIGGFIPRLNMDTVNIKYISDPGNFFRYAYYYLDNFKIEPIYPASVDDALQVVSSLYPNPMKSRAILTFRNSTALPRTVAIFNTLGQQVVHIENITGNQVTIERGDLPAGVYYYTVTDHTAAVAKGKLVME